MNKVILLSIAITLMGSSLHGQYFTTASSGTITTDVGESAGTAWIDYDNDGDLDLFTTNFSSTNNFLYENDGLGGFTRILSGSIVNDGSSSTASTWADYDNDGDLDVFVSVGLGGNNKLYRNEGGGSFTEILTGDIVTNGGSSSSACWGDYDNDGLVDLFVSNNLGENNFLYHNDGGGSFTRIVVGSIVNDGGFSIGATWIDFNNDNLLDLYVTNGDSPQANFLYKNNGSGTFTSILIGSVVTDTQNSRGNCWADFDNDGDMDLFIPTYDNEVNSFYINNGDETFTKLLIGAIVNTNTYSIGAQWGDINNDGNIDLVVGNAHFSGGTASENIIYINNGDGTFTEISSSEPFVDQDLSTVGVALGGYDKDGHLDISAVSNQSDLNSLYHNTGSSNNWVDLLIEGSVSNWASLGAKINLKANIGGMDVWQTREVQSITGTKSQNSLNVEVGLGDASIIDSIIVEWPSGIVCYFTNVAVNDFYFIHESCQLSTECLDPAAGFEYSENGLDLDFTDTSSTTGSTTYWWDFGDGDFSSLQHPDHVYTSAGTYTVCLIVTDSCTSDTACQVITVNNCIDPAADFIWSDSGLDVDFFNTSTGTAGATYWWDFGDANYSSLENPNHVYSAPGTYTVCLTFTDSCDTDSVCEDITITNVGVHELGDGILAVYPNPFNNELTINLNDSAEAGTIKLFDLTGRVVLQRSSSGSTSLVLPVADLTKGVYLLEVATTKGIWSTKVIKQ